MRPIQCPDKQTVLPGWELTWIKNQDERREAPSGEVTSPRSLAGLWLSWAWIPWLLGRESRYCTYEYPENTGKTMAEL